MSTQTSIKTTTKTITGSDGSKKVIVTEEKTVTDSDGKVTVTTTERETINEKPVPPARKKDSENKAEDTLCNKLSADLNLNDKSSAKAKPVDLATFRADVLAAHNNYRAIHGVAPLKVSAKLNDLSQDWADHLAKTGQFQHRPNCDFGENIFFAMKSRGDTSGTEAVDSWYAEIKDYDFHSARFSGNTGHFTQVVWKDSSELGVGCAKTENGKTYVVANYNPAGNIMGKFKENVFPKK